MVQRLVNISILSIFIIMFNMCNFSLSQYEYIYIGEYEINMEKCVTMYPDFDTMKYANLKLKIKPDHSYETSKTFHRITSTTGNWYLKRVDVAVWCHLVSINNIETQIGMDSDKNLMIFIGTRMIGVIRDPIYIYLKKIE